MKSLLPFYYIGQVSVRTADTVLPVRLLSLELIISPSALIVLSKLGHFKYL